MRLGWISCIHGVCFGITDKYIWISQDDLDENPGGIYDQLTAMGKGWA